MNAGTVKCNEATYSGTQIGKTSPWFELAPTYTECTAFGFAGAQVKTNGCEWESVSPSEFGSSYIDTVSLACPSAFTPMTITASLAGTTKCTVTIPPQSGLAWVYFSNEGSGSSRDLRLSFSLSFLQYSQKARSGLGACKTEESRSNGTYVAEATAKAFEELTQKGLWVE